jgi:hypothetical protein
VEVTQVKFFKAIIGKEERDFDVGFHYFQSNSGTEGERLSAVVSLYPNFPHFSLSVQLLVSPGMGS